MRSLLVVIIIFICTIACSEQPQYSTPAQQHINDYTNKLYACQRHNESVQLAAADPVPSVRMSRPRSLNIEADDMTLGNIHSKVVMIEYLSPTCPSCAYYKKNIFPKLKEKYIDTNKIAYVIREFISNKQDLDAAILARCSSSQEDFIKLITVLLYQQDNWATSNKYREILTNIGQLAGITPEQYARCLNDENLAELLIANREVAANSPGFIGTPSLFFNGVLLTEAHNMESLSKSIDKALQDNNTND